MSKYYIVSTADKQEFCYLTDAAVLSLLERGFRIQKRKPLYENSLYVTIGCRAGTMDMMNEIDLPTGVDGEDALAICAEEIVTAWVNREDDDMPFDEFIENRLKETFPVR